LKKTKSEYINLSTYQQLITEITMTLARINEADIGHRSTGCCNDVMHSLPQQSTSRDCMHTWEIRNKALPEVVQSVSLYGETIAHGLLSKC